MTQLYVEYDIENEKILAGPQESKPNDSWVPFFPAMGLKPRQQSITRWAEPMNAVVQLAGAEYVPDYAEQRSNAYPKIGEQLDKLFHDIDNGTLDKTGSFYQTIKGVKDDIPKPEG